LKPCHLRSGPFVFGNVGQFVPWKNQILFLKSAPHVAIRLPDVRFVLVGDDIFGRDPVYKRSVLSHVESSPIAEKIDLLGWCENMDGVWPTIDCLVHTAEGEPFGRVIIEAMANRIPVIAVRSGGPMEIIEDRTTGILVQAGDVEELTGAMLGIAQDGDFARRLADSGYDHAISNFAAERTAAQIQDVYDELLDV
jgi:glycosyltransferase involved in cell wall biosynthesis